MVLCFSGTGNSRYIARRISEALHYNVIDLNEKIKANNCSPIQAECDVIVVTPTYAWRIPQIVSDWLLKTELVGAQRIWFVMDCGGEIGNAAKYNRRLCDEKGLVYMGTAQILMPENYIALFETSEPDIAKRIVAKSEPDIDKVIKDIAAGNKFSATRNNLYDRFMSGPVNKLFYPLCVKAKAFCASDECISCGKCVKVCPLNNIALKDGKPVWGKNCTHCMACISYCPSKAIEYGKHSLNRTKYTFENLK